MNRFPDERVSSPSGSGYGEGDYGQARRLWSVPKPEVADDEVPTEVLERLAERYKDLQAGRPAASAEGILSESVELDA